MRAPAHLAIGCGTALVAVALVPAVLPNAALAVLPWVALGSLLPDLDTPRSAIARSLGPLTWLLAYAVSWVTGGHRSWWHSVYPVLALVLVGLTGVLPLVVALSLAYGWLAHLAADSLTPSGVRWLPGLPVFLAWWRPAAPSSPVSSTVSR